MTQNDIDEQITKIYSQVIQAWFILTESSVTDSEWPKMNFKHEFKKIKKTFI